jgi:hypothetical protein
MKPAASSSLAQGASQVFTPHLYHRLTHPLNHILKELPVVDGTDVNLLCDFLLKVLKIRQVGQFPDQTIYEVMYPYCRGELLAFVTNTIKALQERIFSSFSVPEVLVSDNVQCFASQEFRQFCFELGVKHVTTSPY